MPIPVKDSQKVCKYLTEKLSSSKIHVLSLKMFEDSGSGFLSIKYYETVIGPQKAPLTKI